MRIARFQTKDGKIQHGLVEGQTLKVIEGDALGSLKPTGQTCALADVKLLAPILPPNMLALGRNYKAHAEEGGDDVPKAPALFIKATSCLTNPGDPIVLPVMAPDEVDYEAELAVVIKKAARKVSEAQALDYVLGYTCANDVSARDCQRNDVQWARGKSFETFAPMGPWIETDLDPTNLEVSLRLNGKTMQQANTSLMVFSVRYLISYLSRCTTLLPGTVILTGTPAGCGFAQNPPVYLKAGDSVEVEISGIGTLKNPVRSDA
ncbi:MAG: fumarylacetoacetate hydrolase family protein [Phycisphaerae bacterium]|nr:fumarylacetoacetate hydrolase family protein [Phycisphaerae bacterium]